MISKRSKKSSRSKGAETPREEMSLFGQLSGLVGSVKDQLMTWGSWPFRMVGVVVFSAEQLAKLTPEQSNMLREAGSYLHELRDLAGLTSNELAEALDVEDNSILDAIEQGTATLSFADGITPQAGDVFEISVPEFGLPLRNPLSIVPSNTPAVKAL